MQLQKDIRQFRPCRQWAVQLAVQIAHLDTIQGKGRSIPEIAEELITFVQTSRSTTTPGLRPAPVLDPPNLTQVVVIISERNKPEECILSDKEFAAWLKRNGLLVANHMTSCGKEFIFDTLSREGLML